MQVDSAFPQLGIAAMAGFAQSQSAAAVMPQRTSSEEGTAEERVARTESDSARTAKARVAASKQADIR